MKHIHFIINPVSGHKRQNITISLLENSFETENYNLVIKYSNYKKHAIILTQESITEGANIIVACGGDGTINEVASCLVNTKIILGIIATGSGNGLASNLNIPRKIEKAIDIIKNENIKKIDVGKINNLYFFSNTGIGFDATVINYYENSKTRKLSSYIMATFKSLKKINLYEHTTFKINSNILLTNPFMIFISNSNQLGYNISLTPKASLQDGLLDILLVKKLNLFKVFLFGILILFKKHYLLNEVTIYQGKNLTISKNNDMELIVQIDGEYHQIKKEKISISIIEKSLNVIA